MPLPARRHAVPARFPDLLDWIEKQLDAIDAELKETT